MLPKRRQIITNLRCVKPQKGDDLLYSAAEARNCAKTVKFHPLVIDTLFRRSQRGSIRSAEDNNLGLSST